MEDQRLNYRETFTKSDRGKNLKVNEVQICFPFIIFHEQGMNSYLKSLICESRQVKRNIIHDYSFFILNWIY